MKFYMSDIYKIYYQFKIFWLEYLENKDEFKTLEYYWKFQNYIKKENIYNWNKIIIYLNNIVYDVQVGF